MVIGQSFAPAKKDTKSIRKGVENPKSALDGKSTIVKAAPEDPKHYRLQMFDEPKTTWSEEFYGTLNESGMISARETYCDDDWHSYDQARIVNGQYQSYESEDCEPPPLAFVPSEYDFPPMDAITLSLQ